MTRAATRAYELNVPDDFDFSATVWSHGWCKLAPYAWDPDSAELARPHRLPGGRVTTIGASQPGGRGSAVRLEILAGTGARVGLGREEWHGVDAETRRALDVDRGLAGFHTRCVAAGPPFTRAVALGFGRLLRSPTLFEDLVKVLATTNTSWAGTRAMVEKLVVAAGRGGTFPSSREVVALGEEGIARARWGYRARALFELARAVADGAVDLEAWETWDGSSDELAATVGALRGFGPYATAQVLMLLGRHDRIGVDSVFRSHVRSTHFAGAARPPSIERMLAVYDDWGEWRALAYWFEVWHGRGGPVALAESVDG